MTECIDANPPMSIAEQAAEWLLRWQCHDLRIAERFEYLQWLKTSPVHIAEMLRVCRLYSWLQGVKLELYMTNDDSFSNVLELPPRERESAARRGASTAGLRKRRIVAAVAAIGLIAALAAVVKVGWLDHALRTHAGEWRSVPLSDGSSISAAPYTRLRHVIGDHERRITLSRGLAVFRVARDPSRPFFVDAGGIVVKATGTQFVVERREDEVKVTMREGSAMVSPGEAAGAAFTPVPLTADQELTISAAGMPAVARVNAEASIQRALGRLTFGPGDTIGDAVEQFNAFNALQIVVDDATASRPMRGSFDAIDPDSFVAAVERITGRTAVEESPQVIRIGPRKPDSR